MHVGVAYVGCVCIYAWGERGCFRSIIVCTFVIYEPGNRETDEQINGWEMNGDSDPAWDAACHAY